MIDELADYLMGRRRDRRMRRDPVTLLASGVTALAGAGASYLTAKKTPNLPPPRPEPDQQDAEAKRKARLAQEQANFGRQGTILAANSNAAGSPTYVNQTFGS